MQLSLLLKLLNQFRKIVKCLLYVRARLVQLLDELLGMAVALYALLCTKFRLWAMHGLELTQQRFDTFLIVRDA